MEIDNIIYIVLIIAIFTFSLLGQTKKKKIPRSVAVNEDIKYSLNDFEKILERKQEYQKKEEQNPVNEAIDAELPVEPTRTTTHQDKSVKHQDKKEENEINDGFDLRSAIVYSSILERKKFRH
jgi:hypothetical protein